MALTWTNGPSFANQSNGGRGAGTVSASFILQGYNGGANPKTYTFDGTNFTASTDYAHGFNAGFACGTQSSVLAGGGYNHTTSANAIDTNKWNGSSWSSGGNLPAANRAMSQAGNQSAAVIFGGYTTSVTDAVITYNGSSWSTSAATLSSARDGLAGGGTATAALVVGGDSSGTKATTTEVWNGTSLSAGGNLNTGRDGHGATVNGSTGAFVVGGKGGGSTSSESYNGSSWTSATNMNSSRQYCGGSGTGTTGFIFGGVSNLTSETFTGGPEEAPPDATFIPRVTMF